MEDKHINIKHNIELLEKYENQLEMLNNDIIELSIYSNNHDDYLKTIFTIGTDGNCEHQYSKEAIKFIEYIKNDLVTKINSIKLKVNMNTQNKKYILLGLSLLYDQMVHERLRSEDENIRAFCLEESNLILMLIKDIENDINKIYE